MNNKITVSKFGGSSVADSVAMKRSAKVAIDNKASFVLVSATYGTTNTLIELTELAKQGKWEDCVEMIESIKERHFKIGAELEINPNTREDLENIFLKLETLARGICLLQECSPRAMDKMLSFGELLSSHLFSQAVRSCTNDNVEFFDIRKVMKTNSNFNKAIPCIETIKKEATKHINLSEAIYVSQGFIGSTIDDELTTTLGRGGSDYSAALIAEAVGADLVQIWTDVPGIATVDPRICSEAKSLKEISFREAAELAMYGAKVLHPTTIAPAKRANIPVFVGSSINPEKGGTWIKKDCSLKPFVRAMAIKKDQLLVTITTPKMLDTHGFLSQLFKHFEDEQISVDSVTTSEISIAVTIDKSEVLSEAFLKKLSVLGEVEIEHDLNMISLIGNNINKTSGLGTNIFESLSDSKEPVNIRMICQGASKHNFCFLVEDSQALNAVKKLHERLIESHS